MRGERKEEGGKGGRRCDCFTILAKMAHCGVAHLVGVEWSCANSNPHNQLVLLKSSV